MSDRIIGGEKLIHQGNESSNEEADKTDLTAFFSAAISRIESRFERKTQCERGTK